MSRRWPLIALILLATLAALAGGGAWLAHHDKLIPNGDDPWARLDLDAAPGWFTKYQLGKLRDDPVACFAALKEARISYQAIPDAPIVNGCGFADALRWQGEKARFKEPVVLTCAMTAALVLFERQVMQPAAEHYLGSRVIRLDDYGTYNCRNIGREEGRRRSEHAKANAIDIAAFTTANGRRAAVAADWGAMTRPEGKFLLALRDGACGLFKVVLGPAYNTDHTDHFHLDMGPFSSCH